MNDKKQKNIEHDENEEIEQEEQIEQVFTENDEVEEKLSELDNKYKRALADYRNLEQRVSEQRGEWIKSANKDLLLRLLPILDTLMLAQKHTEDKNLSVSIQQFFDILKNEGVMRIEAEGKEFDPALMECVAIDTGDENIVVEELRTGFLLHDKILRPAEVKVGNGEKVKN